MEVNVIYSDKLSELIQNGEKIQIVDIREEYEIENEGKSNGLHIPMGDLVSRIDELNKTGKVVFHCSSGNRSMNILKFFVMNNLYKENYYSLDGGFKEWAKYI
ncbi:MAG: hypothetical protein CL846_10655 [Crocinitomicaceae bacterium]|nr:hypothetical protein [Crocinitomicaceae bacterium]|tara:strand:- start:6048 stop:6356 length:309 start_codon:yes stop_codon:yes gene_type:complete